MMSQANHATQETEWERIQRRIGNLPPAEVAVTQEGVEALVDETVREYDPLARKTLDELDELEDEEDDAVLQEYRRKRVEEMRAQAARPHYGSLVHFNSDEFIPEISEAPKETYVVLLLEEYGQEESSLLAEALTTLARKFPTTKFGRMKATDVIKGYPTRNVPTLLVYKGGDIVTQFVTLRPFGGLRLTPLDVEWQLGQFGIVETDMEEDPRGKMENRVFVNVFDNRLRDA